MYINKADIPNFIAYEFMENPGLGELLKIILGSSESFPNYSELMTLIFQTNHPYQRKTMSPELKAQLKALLTKNKPGPIQ